MKRYVDELKLVFTHLLADASYAYPALAGGFEKDLLRLTRMSDCRGIHFFMVDLPQLGKHLDKCLAEGQYSTSQLPVSRPGAKGAVIPKLFRGLYLLIFDINGCLKEDADVTAILFLRQLLLVAKKATVPCGEVATTGEIQAFCDTEGELPMPPNSWASPTEMSLIADHRGFQFSEQLVQRACQKFGNERGLRLLRSLDTVSSYLSLSLGRYSPDDWNFKHGPGSVSDVVQGGNRFEFKNWSCRLEDVFPSSDYSFHNYGAWARALCDQVEYSSHEPCSRLIAVPKTLSKPRLIASEPSEMMFCQQNLWHYFKTRVEDCWIAEFVQFSDQTQNQVLARQGSLDGSLATIDLSSASDRVTPEVVGNVFRANLGLLRALAATRTRFCEIPRGDSTELVELRKYSTMGNATTFPVETLTFLACVLACALEETGLTSQSLQGLYGKVSIFGDDIIVPRELAGTVMDLLEVLHFKVNTNKSFLTGLFRESCGVDAFRGVCVTPAYWHGPHDGSPESYASRIEVSNNLYKRFLVQTSAFIEAGTHGIRFPRVPLDSGVLGFECFCAPPAKCPTRWNKGLQRHERWVPQLYAKTVTTPMNTDTALLQFFTEQPDPQTMWVGGVRSRPVSKIRHRWVPVAQFSRTDKQLI